MAQVTIIINGQKYRLTCEDGEESHIAQLADYVSKRILKIKQSAGSIGNERLLVMAALTIADEYWDAKNEIRDVQYNIDLIRSPQLTQEFQVAADRLETLKEKLTDIEQVSEADSDKYELEFKTGS